MKTHDIFFIFLGYLSEVIGTISGFGSSTFFVPLAMYLEAYTLTITLTAILHCFSNFSKLFLFFKSAPKNLVLYLAVPSVLLAGIGASLHKNLTSPYISKLLGVSLVLTALGTLLRKRRKKSYSMPTAIVACSFSGFLTGLIGTGGALRGLALSALQLEKNSFVALSAMIDVIGDLLRAVIYLRLGYMDWNQWFYLPALGIAALLGTFTGKLVLTRISQEQFEKSVALVILISGIGMLFKS